MVEHLPCKQEVAGSSPIVSSKNMQGCPSGQREQTVNLPAYAFEGSNPSPCTNFRGNNSIGRVSAFQAECRGFEPRFPLHLAAIAQLVEHVLGKDEVTSSILVGSSKYCLFFVSI